MVSVTHSINRIHCTVLCQTRIRTVKMSGKHILFLSMVQILVLWTTDVYSLYKYKSGIQRPCPDLSLSCMQNFLSSRSRCLPESGTLPSKVSLSSGLYPVPHCNVTVIANDVEYENLMGTVTDMFVDKHTNTLVIATHFEQPIKRTKHGVIFYHFKDELPVYTVSSIVEKFYNITVTTTFPSADYIDLAASTSWSYIDRLPDVTFFNHTVNSTDPRVKDSMNKLTSDLYQTMQEVFVVQGRYMFGTTIQSICDFNLRF